MSKVTEAAFLEYIRAEYSETDYEYYKPSGYIRGDSKRMDDEYSAFNYALNWLLEKAKEIAGQTPVGTNFENMKEFNDRRIKIKDLEELFSE